MTKTTLTAKMGGIIYTQQMPKQYFLQTPQWFKFWQDLNLPNHNTHFFETDKIACHARQFPWHFNSTFLYIPKGPYFKDEASKEILRQELPKLVDIIKSSLKDQNIAFIKFEFSPEIFNLEKNNFNTLIQSIDEKFIQTDKHLQFLQTFSLDTKKLNVETGFQEISNENLEKFYQDNLEWWKQRNNNVNRYTKKSLKQNWIISTAKTQDNFENFWKVHKSTIERQDFSANSKKYFQTFFNQEMSRIIVLKGEANQPQAVWLGANIDDQLVYLYGGNTEKSFDNYGQYLIHLTALFEGVQEGVSSYDLGGYDSEAGYGRFKENYRGDLIDFGDAFDYPIKGFRYKITNIVIKIAKLIKK